MLLYNIYDKQVNPISFFFSNQKTKIGLWLYKFTPQRHHLWHYLSLKNKKERFLFLGGEGLTSMLSLPLKKEATSWMSFSLWSREDASHTDPDTTKPFPSHSFKHLFSSASFLEQVYTDAPNPASSSTTACLIINKKKHIHSFIQSTKPNSNKRVFIWITKEEEEDPMPRVPPVTRAVMPLRDHFEPLTLLLKSDSAIDISVSVSVSVSLSLTLFSEFNLYRLTFKYYIYTCVCIKFKKKKKTFKYYHKVINIYSKKVS